MANGDTNSMWKMANGQTISFTKTRGEAIEGHWLDEDFDLHTVVAETVGFGFHDFHVLAWMAQLPSWEREARIARAEAEAYWDASPKVFTVPNAP